MRNTYSEVRAEDRKKGTAGIIIRIFVLLLSIAAAAAIIFILSRVSFSNQQDIGIFIEAKLEKARVPGASVAIMRNGRLDRTWYAGLADREAGKPVTDTTLFQIGSISKTVTGTAVMQLEEQGRIDLDQNINDLLPFDIVHPRFPKSPVTVRMLMAHMAGITEQQSLYDSLYTIEAGGGDSPVSLEQIVSGCLCKGGKWYGSGRHFAAWEPGGRRAYSNLGYAVLGYIVEYVSGMPFNQYCRKYIFAPLQMTRTGWLLADVDTSMVAVPYENGTTRLPLYSFPTYPDGTLKTTVVEYAALLSAMCSRGTYGDAEILRESTVRQVFSPQDSTGRQLLTWVRNPLKGLRLPAKDVDVIGHTGGDPGVLAIALFNKRTGSGLILFMNSSPELDLRAVNLYLMARRLLREAEIS